MLFDQVHAVVVEVDVVLLLLLLEERLVVVRVVVVKDEQPLVLQYDDCQLMLVHK